MTEETPLTIHTRNIDETLARFSAVHDEAHAELIEKERRRGKLGKMINRLIDDDEPFDEGDPPTTTIRATPDAAPKRRFARRSTKAVPAADDDAEVDDLAADGVADFHQDSERTEFSALDANLDDADEPAAASVKAKTVVPAPELKLTIRQRAGRATAVTLAAIVFLVTGFGWGARGWVDNQFREISALDDNSDLVNQPEKQYGDENFLIVGSDSRAGAEEGDNVGTTEDHSGALADVVMIAHIPASRERLVMVSFTRDLEVSRPECQRWDPDSGDYLNETAPAAEITKLNAVYGVGGPQCLREVVQQISGLSFSRFVGIDFGGFREMVDAVEGVEICTPVPLIDQELGTVIPDPGQQEIDGATALNYVRARKVEGDPTGDYGRMHRQQLFLSSLLRKVMSAEVMLDPGQLTAFVRAFAGNTFGENITVDGLMTLGQSLQQLQTDRVTFVTLPTVGEANERGGEEMRVDDVNALFQAIIDDQPLPQEAGSEEGETTPEDGEESSGDSGSSADSAGLMAPDGIKIQVLNASDIGGAAGSVSSALAELGFDVVLQGNAPEQVSETTIRYSPQRASEAATLAATLNNAVLVEDPAAGGAVSLLIGPDYDGDVHAPGPGTSSMGLSINPSAVDSGSGSNGTGTEEPEGGNEVPDNLETINAGNAECSFWAGG
ncbi:LCP family protein [Actinoalloteichus hymeniacidonis]|uniref:Transcriptional attenuator, LytR family n=1 Tax=Actinoalloteichus hymeniacidonis TaxID=340345 RepID=A0AAC9HUZ5_9PSEU|nr:LCP family protein [Actinoalloteichus hymeniacidonis]AOS65943.1 transcriptional attenuator, LytR family [Actinoalloteichus hymeniacidonis]MBB5905961.1 LCP family protein required for cell wall assembly [Actinoalloteichus hymeniacidonis]